MKKLGKIFTFILSIVMVLTVGVVALADGNDGTITISNAQWGQTYNIYRIFDLSGGQAEEGSFTAYRYTVSEKWKEFFKDGTGALDYVTIDEQGYVTWKKTDAENHEIGAADFAKLAIEYAKSKSIAYDKTETVRAKTAGDGESTIVEFKSLPYGYYLVDSSLGALCSLNSTNPSVSINDKNGIPVVEKQVKEGSNWQDNNDGNTGDTAEFRAIITVKNGAENYVLHDKMSDGLTYISVSEVKLNDETTVDSSKYTVKASELTDGCTFEVSFDNDYLETLASDSKLYVYYTAKINENAVICGTGNPNEVYLSYGDTVNESNKTVTDKTITYTWEYSVFKYTKKNDTETALADAKFSVYTDASCTTAVNLVDITGTEENAVPTYRVCTLSGCTHTHITSITTNDTGKFRIVGFDSGTYYLKETEAPAGYNLVKDAIAVTIDNTGTVKTGETTLNDKTVKVENNTGAVLPSTGGMGTTIFYAVGGLLVVCAMVFFVVKKRMGTES